jgi:hypothetical protein
MFQQLSLPAPALPLQVVPVFLHGTTACVGNNTRNPCVKQQPCVSVRHGCAWVAHTIRMFRSNRPFGDGAKGSRMMQLGPGWLHSPNQTVGLK